MHIFGNEHPHIHRFQELYGSAQEAALRAAQIDLPFMEGGGPCTLRFHLLKHLCIALHGAMGIRKRALGLSDLLPFVGSCGLLRRQFLLQLLKLLFLILLQVCQGIDLLAVLLCPSLTRFHDLAFILLKLAELPISGFASHCDLPLHLKESWCRGGLLGVTGNKAVTKLLQHRHLLAQTHEGSSFIFSFVRVRHQLPAHSLNDSFQLLQGDLGALLILAVGLAESKPSPLDLVKLFTGSLDLLLQASNRRLQILCNSRQGCNIVFGSVCDAGGLCDRTLQPLCGLLAACLAVCQGLLAIVLLLHDAFHNFLQGRHKSCSVDIATPVMLQH
mmetsp:Transcript_54225/g.129220  ORF Transcript_54225/g.129220 Transcript_54225/m.129220 type:complete len:330 (-) Transcript_54225:238-1227(-)